MEERLTLQEKIIKEQFNLLREHIGDEVLVEHYEYGKLLSEVFKIQEVYDYMGISFDIMYMAFLGYNCAIKRILTLDGKVLYEAKGLPEPYGYYDKYQLVDIIRKVYGETQAQNEMDMLEKSEKQEAERKRREKEYIVQYQEEVLPQLLMVTKPLIIEELYEDWKSLCNKNSTSTYGIAIIKMTAEIMMAISQGMNINDALREFGKKYHSSGYSDSLVVTTISKYAIFGEEVKREWNSEYGMENVEGVVNPAIIHIKQ